MLPFFISSIVLFKARNPVEEKGLVNVIRLGQTKLQQKVCWKKFGRSDFLIEKSLIFIL